MVTYTKSRMQDNEKDTIMWPVRCGATESSEKILVHIVDKSVNCGVAQLILSNRSAPPTS